MRKALRREIALLRFDYGAATCVMPYAEAAGHVTDEDVFRDVSRKGLRRHRTHKRVHDAWPPR
jgi:hypothetical protein